ncbi:unnamed protein product, partial [Protopolystoma xenopodis]
MPLRYRRQVDLLVGLGSSCPPFSTTLSLTRWLVLMFISAVTHQVVATVLCCLLVQRKWLQPDMRDGRSRRQTRAQQ